MSDITTTPEIDILVDLDLSKLKNKLRRKIVKNIKKSKLGIKINVDVYGISHETEIYTEAIVSRNFRKSRKNKK